MIAALVISNILSWLAVIALTIVTFALIRQVGLLHERMGPVGALTVAKGLKTGEPVPVMTLPSLTGGEVTIGGTSLTGRSTLLFFLSPDCPVCKDLLPVIASVASREAGWLNVVFASDGDLSEQRAFVVRQGLAGYPYVLSAELGQRLGVGKLPYVVLIDENGTAVAHGLANTREHIESLFVAREQGVSSIQEFVEKERGAA